MFNLTENTDYKSQRTDLIKHIDLKTELCIHILYLTIKVIMYSSFNMKLSGEAFKWALKTDLN